MALRHANPSRSRRRITRWGARLHAALYYARKRNRARRAPGDEGTLAPGTVLYLDWMNAVASGDEVDDLTGNHTAALPTGAYALGPAGLLKTDSSTVTVPDSDDWAFDGANWCIELVWTKTAADLTPADWLIGSHETPSERAFLIRVGDNVNDIWAVVSSNGIARTTITASGIADGRHHIVLNSVDGRVVLYIDGINMGARDFTPINNSPSDLMIEAPGTYEYHSIIVGDSVYGDVPSFTPPPAPDLLPGGVLFGGTWVDSEAWDDSAVWDDS